MAPDTKPNKRLSKKQQRLAEQEQAARLKKLRIAGIVFIFVILLAGVYFWRSSNQVPLTELQAQAAPNVDGPLDAPVRIVEFGDFGCPSCRAWHNAGIKERLQAAYGEQIAFEFRHFPVITAQSPLAAEAAQCAAEQEAFWSFHDYIYEQTAQGALGRNDLKGYAASLGLNQTQFDACLDAGKYQPFVRHDWDAALAAGARGTPTFLIDGQRVDPNYETLTAVIEQTLNN